MNEYKKCSHCSKLQKLGSFTRDKTREDGLSSWCKQCVKKYRKLNEKSLKEYEAKYYRKTHPFKKCASCKKLKSASTKNFDVDIQQKNGLNCRCKKCESKRKLDAYYLNRKNPLWITKHQARARKLSVTYRLQRRRIIENLKINGCAICGYDKCPDALSFHHINPKDKSFCLSIKSLHYADKRVIEELNKCVLLCSNCHNEIHYKEKLGRC